MTTRHFASRISTPDGTVGGHNGGGKTTLATLMQPMEQTLPSGILTDPGMTTTAPDTSGMVFVPWNAVDSAGRSQFNQQGQHWVQVPNTISVTPTQTCCVNNTRSITQFTDPDLPSTGHMDINFMTNSSEVIFCFQGYSARSVYKTPDTQCYVEHQGRMYKASELPQTTSWSGTSKTLYRQMTMDDGSKHALREWRMISPSIMLWFQGVWIKQGCVIYSAPPKPLMVLEGDSWVEGNNIFSHSAGYDPDLGSFYSYGSREALMEATGFKFAPAAQGGTGWWSANTHDTDPDITDPINTVFGSQARANDYHNFWQNQAPVALIYEGSANDNGHVTSIDAHRDRVVDGLDRYLAYDADLPIILISVQSKDNPTPGGGSGADKSRQGLFAAAALRPNNIIGVIDQMTWLSGAGSAGSPADSQWGQLILADGLHVNRAGARHNGQRWADAMSRMSIPTDRLNDCYAAASDAE